MKITLDWLAQRNACLAAREAFTQKFPNGATYVDVQAALHDENRADWSWWLVDAIYRDLLENPAEVTTQSVGAHVDISNKIIAASPLAVIGTPTTDAAQIGSSGDAARIGSNDMVRTWEALRGIEGKRLTYKPVKSLLQG